MEIIIVRGGCKSITPAVCNQTDVHYGVREDYTPYASVYMLDWDFESPYTDSRWTHYLELVQQYHPQLVMIPDYFEHVSVDLLRKQINELRSVFQGIILVCPKFLGAVMDIPRDCRVAISVPVGDDYGGFLPLPDEVVGRELHLLGGHPDQWAYLQNVAYRNATVVSADGNALIRQADAYGKYWSPLGKYVEMRGQGFDSTWLAIASIRNTQIYLDSKPMFFTSSRVGLCRRALSGFVPVALFN